MQEFGSTTEVDVTPPGLLGKLWCCLWYRFLTNAPPLAFGACDRQTPLVLEVTGVTVAGCSRMK